MPTSRNGNKRNHYTIEVKQEEYVIHGRSDDRSSGVPAKHHTLLDHNITCAGNERFKVSLHSCNIPITFYTIDENSNKFTLHIQSTPNALTAKSFMTSTTTGVNNDDIDKGVYRITIPVGVYDGSTLASEITRQMNNKFPQSTAVDGSIPNTLAQFVINQDSDAKDLSTAEMTDFHASDGVTKLRKDAEHLIENELIDNLTAAELANHDTLKFLQPDVSFDYNDALPAKQSGDSITQLEGRINAKKCVPRFHCFFDTQTNRIIFHRVDNLRLFGVGGFRLIFGQLGKQLGFNHLTTAEYLSECNSNTVLNAAVTSSSSRAGNPRVGNLVTQGFNDTDVVYTSHRYSGASRYLEGRVTGDINAPGPSALVEVSDTPTKGDLTTGASVFEHLFEHRIIPPRQVNIGKDSIFFHTNFNSNGYDTRTGKNIVNTLAIIPITVSEGDKLFYTNVSPYKSTIKSKEIREVDVHLTDRAGNTLNMRGGDFEYNILIEKYDIVDLPIVRPDRLPRNKHKREAQNLVDGMNQTQEPYDEVRQIDNIPRRTRRRIDFDSQVTVDESAQEPNLFMDMEAARG